MKILILVLSVSSVAFIFTQQNVAQAKLDVSTVKWMAGCWELRNDAKQSLTIEQWTTSDGGAMFGVGRTFKAGKLVSWEMMRIVRDGESAKFFAQLPDAAQATGFALKSSTATEMVFENLQNDFPNRVLYRNTGTDKLLGRIEGTMNAKERAIDFPMTRAKCG